MYNLINIHTYIRTSYRINASGIDDSDDRAGLRGYVQFNKYTYRQTDRQTDRQAYIHPSVAPDQRFS